MPTRFFQNVYRAAIKSSMLIAGMVVAMMVLGGGPQRIVAEETVSLTNGEWPPYYGEHLPHYGSDSQIVTEAFALSGVTVKYQFFPWARALNMARDDSEFDGGVGWGSSAEYQKDFYISEPSSTYQMVFFHRKDFPFHWTTYADLKGLRIGLTLEYDYPEELQKMIANGTIKADWAAKDEFNFKKLLSGRIDAYVDDKLVGLLVMKRIFTLAEMDQLTYHKTMLKEESLHLVLSKKNARNQQLIILFNEGLKRLKESGRYDEIQQAALQGAYNPQ